MYSFKLLNGRLTTSTEKCVTCASACMSKQASMSACLKRKETKVSHMGSFVLPKLRHRLTNEKWMRLADKGGQSESTQIGIPYVMLTDIGASARKIFATQKPGK